MRPSTASRSRSICPNGGIEIVPIGHVAPCPVQHVAVGGDVVRGPCRVDVIEVTVSTGWRAEVLRDVLLIEQHDAQPVRLDFGQVPHHAEQAQGRPRQRPLGELVSIQAGDLQQDGVAVQVQPVVEHGAFVSGHRPVGTAVLVLEYFSGTHIVAYGLGVVLLSAAAGLLARTCTRRSVLVGGAAGSAALLLVVLIIVLESTRAPA